MNQSPSPDREPEAMSLTEVAAILDVHYMTAYRYVRRGRLNASKAGGQWQVLPGDLDRFRSGEDTPAGAGANVGVSVWSQRYEKRLLAADQTGAWGVLDDARISGLEVAETYLRVIAPALERIGAGWARGEHGVAAEHVATGIIRQHLGRLSPAFTPRGQRKGSVLLGCPPGEHHDLGLNMVADLFTAAGFATINLGGNTPASAFQEAFQANDRVAAIGISSHHPASTRSTRTLIDDLRVIAPGTPIIVGGALATRSTAEQLAADHATNDVLDAIAWLTESADRHQRSSPVESGT